MIYINFVELHFQMLHTKFQNHRPSGSDATYQVSWKLAHWLWRRRFLNVFAIYSPGGHLGHVTLTIYINFHSPFPRMLHMKFGFDWPSGFREDVFFLIQFYVPFKIISAHMRRANQ